MITVIGHPSQAGQDLAGSLGAELMPAPILPAPSGWAWDWRDDVAAFADRVRALPRRDRVVVCTWSASTPAQALVDTDPGAWSSSVEQPLALWFAGIVAAGERCMDGGSLVVVVERPAGLDSGGRAAEVAVGEGLLTLVRSIALTNGARQVRTNAVITEVTTAPKVLLGLPPALATFPGTPAVEVAGAVRMLLSSDSAGVSGTAVRADCGRSWS